MISALTQKNMNYESKSSPMIFSILSIGIILRLVLFIVSPPNNSFDDHLEVVYLYATNLQIPSPSDCWECYQPPLYYSISGQVYTLAYSLSESKLIAWKTVQIVNPMLSILALLVFWRIIESLSSNKNQKIIYLCFVAILPVDIFTATMIGNDYLLIFITIVAFFQYQKCINSLKATQLLSYKKFILLLGIVMLGCLTKQHGLILLAFPAILIIQAYFQNKNLPIAKLILLFLIFLTLGISNELWKYHLTNKILVSNQDFFDYAQNQFPGEFELVELASFKISALFSEPFISEKTSASLPTELFARMFFDYEYRFLNPQVDMAIFLGKFGFSVGICWIIYLFSTITIAVWKKREELRKQPLSTIVSSLPIAIGLLFLLVPLVQTIRYPYFSSMKTTFILPGLFILIPLIVSVTKAIKVPKWLTIMLVSLSLSYSIMLVLLISIYIPQTIHQLNGPLWQIP
jgi:hypothetical protein